MIRIISLSGSTVTLECYNFETAIAFAPFHVTILIYHTQMGDNFVKEIS